jgi:hypothetical protein
MSEKAHSAKAGAPKPSRNAGAASARAAASPRRLSDAQLDARDWAKAGPRRLAGPPLDDGGTSPAAEAFRPEQLPSTTDPEEHSRRRS